MNYIGWLIVFVIFAALELVSLGMTCIWFAIGALAACVTSLITGNWIIQAFVFIIVRISPCSCILHDDPFQSIYKKSS